MELNEYQRLAMRTEATYKNQEDRLLNGVMGLNGASGETIDIVKKYKYQGHELNIDKLIEELGDVLWYAAETADSVGIPLDIVAQRNIDKLKERFPEGFSKDKSINRSKPLYRIHHVNINIAEDADEN